MDEVIYGNQTPWPASANGGGTSLQRIAVSASGNHPANWFAGTPTAGLIATGDRDGDGMPDAWELDNDLNPDDPGDALSDADADGCTNLHEYLAGTDPSDPSSALKLTVNAQGSGVRLQFPVVAGRSYSVQRRDDLSPSSWTKLQDFPPAPSNGIAETTDSSPTNSPQRFYRVVRPSL